MDATKQVDPFTKLLAELSRRLTKLEEVKTLKHIVIGSPRVGKADIEDCDTGLLLFRKLQERHLITENDTKYLAEILDILGRKDLVQKVITYCEKNGKEIPLLTSNQATRMPGTPGYRGQTEKPAKCATQKFPYGGELTVPAGLPFINVTGHLKDQFRESASIGSVPNKLAVMHHQNTTGHSVSKEVSQRYLPSTQDSLPSLSEAGFTMETDGPSEDHVSNIYMDTNSGTACNNSGNHQEMTDGCIKNSSAKEQIDHGPGALLLGSEQKSVSQEGRLDTSTNSDGERKEPLKLWAYQEELASAALRRENCIICAPTGSGKTIIAAHISKTLRDQCKANNKSFKALFIVCIRSLTSQQTHAFHSVFTGEDKKIVQAMPPNGKLEKMIEAHDIIMLTAQIFLNALKRTEINCDHQGIQMSNFDLLLFDECHHTDLKHPYNQIMRMYQKVRMKNTALEMPQIIGLTASLGAGSSDSAVEHYIRMCGNLNCKIICHVRHHVEDLEAHNPKPTNELIEEVAPRQEDDPVITCVQTVMKEIENTLAGIELKCYQKGSQPYENWVVSMKQKAEEEGVRIRRVQFEALYLLNGSLLIYEDLLGYDCLQHITEGLKSLLPKEPTEDEKYIENLVLEAVEKLQPLAEERDALSNPKMVKLVELLVKINTNKKNATGIILAKTRLGTKALLGFIENNQQLRTLVKPQRLVGKAGEGLTQSDAEQKQILKQFRLGETTLLIATDVAQEGLDIPRCNYVIRYNFVSNEIGSVQSRGRARAKGSECYLIVTQGSANILREHQNRMREQDMMEALKKVDEMDKEELQRRIDKMQEILWNSYQKEEERKALLSSQASATDVEILCKGCRTFLCFGSDIILKGQAYICVSDDFEAKVKIEEDPELKEFRDDVQIGSSICVNPNCYSGIGPVKRYKRDARELGYVISAKTILYRIKGSRAQTLKKWKNAPFKVHEEVVG